MIVRIQVRRDTAENWASANPILASGEFGYETDLKGLKMGDGVTPWAELGYITADIVYLSAQDFEGTGETPDDPIRIRR